MGMDPLSSGVEAAGSVVSSLIGAHSASKQMEFQERMSSTAHQREVADLKKAGLNPLLTAGGSGSSTPPGTSFTPENPMRGLTKNLLDAQTRKLQEQQTINSAKEAAKIDSEKAYYDALTGKVSNESSQIEQLLPLLVKKTASETLVNSASAQRIKNQNVAGGVEANLWDIVGEPAINAAKKIKEIGSGIWSDLKAGARKAGPMKPLKIFQK